MEDLTFDLEQLAAHLKRDSLHEKLWKSIRRAHTVSSVATDLLKTSRSLSLIRRLQATGGMPDAFTNEEGGSLIEALFISSVIVYARATVSTPIDRQPWWSAKKLDPELRVIHDNVIRLRNKEFAHFGKGTQIGGEPLLKEVLYLAPGRDSPVSFWSSSWATRPEFVFDMIRLVGAVHDEAREKMEASFRSVLAELKHILSSDHSFESLIRKFEMKIAPFPRLDDVEAIEEGPRITKVWTKVQTRVLRNDGKVRG